MKQTTITIRKWSVRRQKPKIKKSEELKQLQNLVKIEELLAKQIAQYEFDKAEYQRTGIQH